MSFDDLESYTIDCPNAVQQINFLNSQKTTRQDVFASQYELSKYKFVSKIVGLPGEVDPGTADFRQHSAVASDSYNATIMYKIAQINQYCLKDFDDPYVCSPLRPYTASCKRLRGR